MNLKTVTVEDKRLDSEREFIAKSGPKKGQKSMVYNVSLKIRGRWYKGSVWNKQDFEKMSGAVTVEMYQQQYNGKSYWNWRIPSPKDMVESRLNSLEERIALLENQLNK